MKRQRHFLRWRCLLAAVLHEPEAPSASAGNMPMTKQEYQEAPALLLKKQPLPAEVRICGISEGMRRLCDLASPRMALRT